MPKKQVNPKQSEGKPNEGDDSLFAQLLAESTSSNVPREGEVIEGKVVALSKGEALIDYGGKAEGVVQGRELATYGAEDEDLMVGADVLAVVLMPEDEEGRAVLSLRRARAERKWREMKNKFENKIPVTVSVVQPNMGGLIVNAEGLQGFVPISQLGPDHYPSSIQKGPGFADAAIAYLTQFVGAEFQGQIIEFERDNNRLILSERILLQRTRGLKPAEELGFKIGDVVKGKVVAIKDFGVFVDLKTTSGLVHISEMSWDRVNHPGDLVKDGQELEVKVIGIEEGGRRVSLSMKQLLDNPWAQVARKYEIGQTVKGIVTKIVDYGAFVQIEQGFDGLVHISELSSFHVKDPADILQEGQEYEFKIILLELDHQRLGLSYRQANPEPLPEQEQQPKADIPASAEPVQTVKTEDSGEPGPAAEVEEKASEEPAPAPESPLEELGVDRDEAIKELTQLEGVGPKVAEKLYDAGFTSIEKVDAATLAGLSLIPGVRRGIADKIKQAAKNHLA